MLLLFDLDVVETVVEHAAADTPVEDGGLVDTDQVNEALNPDDALEALDRDDVEHPVVAPSVVVADIPAWSGSDDVASIEPRAWLPRRGPSTAASKKVDQREGREARGQWASGEGGTRTMGVGRGSHANNGRRTREPRGQWASGEGGTRTMGVGRGRHADNGRPQQPRLGRRRGVMTRTRQRQVETREGLRRARP